MSGNVPNPQPIESTDPNIAIQHEFQNESLKAGVAEGSNSNEEVSTGKPEGTVQSSSTAVEQKNSVELQTEPPDIKPLEVSEQATLSQPVNLQVPKDVNQSDLKPEENISENTSIPPTLSAVEHFEKSVSPPGNSSEPVIVGSVSMTNEGDSLAVFFS